jgi:hypothetical protein
MTDDERARYESRIADLQDTIERITRSGVENATRYAADIAAERRAGAAAVERIRAALLEGASDETQARAVACALRVTSDEPSPSCAPTLYGVCSAFLALSASHAEARALLSDISTRALALLGKGST